MGRKSWQQIIHLVLLEALLIICIGVLSISIIFLLPKAFMSWERIISIVVKLNNVVSAVLKVLTCAERSSFYILNT